MIVADAPIDELHWVRLRCDACAGEVGTFNPTRDQCNYVLYAAGWRLYRRKTLCPECAGKIAKRLQRRQA